MASKQADGWFLRKRRIGAWFSAAQTKPRNNNVTTTAPTHSWKGWKYLRANTRQEVRNIIITIRIQFIYWTLSWWTPHRTHRLIFLTSVSLKQTKTRSATVVAPGLSRPVWMKCWYEGPEHVQYCTVPVCVGTVFITQLSFQTNYRQSMSRE